MKKILLLATVALTLCGGSVFGQGYFVFTTSPRTTWDTWSTPGTPHLAADNNVAFLFGSGTPLVATATGLSSIPTNNVSAVNATLAWSSILTDPNFSLATNSSSGVLASILVGANGSANYNASSSFPVTGTGVNGGNTTVFLIGWSSAFATPQLAAANGAPVGWSAAFAYTYTSVIGTPSGFGLVPFGVAPVPEPTTFALAGLGALALLAFRRRKS